MNHLLDLSIDREIQALFFAWHRSLTFNWIIDTNLEVYNNIQKSLPYLKKSKAPLQNIVIFSSILAKLGGRGCCLLQIKRGAIVTDQFSTTCLF